MINISGVIGLGWLCGKNSPKFGACWHPIAVFAGFCSFSKNFFLGHFRVLCLGVSQKLGSGFLQMRGRGPFLLNPIVNGKDFRPQQVPSQWVWTRPIFCSPVIQCKQLFKMFFCLIYSRVYSCLLSFPAASCPLCFLFI